MVDGDPFEDFDTLVRTVSVLRGGTPCVTQELVAAFEPPSKVSASASASASERWRDATEED
ncbi:hypothetical protein [Streptomyces mirabilis]|uniref:hypothetical protein n=1 Tax=Streptomyces mirabilis TaxID=68239 RepID=UPI000942F612